jgi:hypothetical protein
MLSSCSARDTSSSDEDAGRPSGRSVGSVPRDWFGFGHRDGLRSPRRSNADTSVDALASSRPVGRPIGRSARNARGEQVYGEEEVQVAATCFGTASRSRVTLRSGDHRRLAALWKATSPARTRATLRCVCGRAVCCRAWHQLAGVWVRTRERVTASAVVRVGSRLRSRGDAGRIWFGNNRRATTAVMQNGCL